MSAPSPKLIEALHREKLRAAERMTPGERLLAGPRLFDAASVWTKAGIRSENPGISEEGVHRIFRERLELIRRMDLVPC